MGTQCHRHHQCHHQHQFHQYQQCHYCHYHKCCPPLTPMSLVPPVPPALPVPPVLPLPPVSPVPPVSLTHLQDGDAVGHQTPVEREESVNPPVPPLLCPCPPCVPPLPPAHIPCPPDLWGYSHPKTTLRTIPMAWWPPNLCPASHDGGLALPRGPQQWWDTGDTHEASSTQSSFSRMASMWGLVMTTSSSSSSEGSDGVSVVPIRSTMGLSETQGTSHQGPPPWAAPHFQWPCSHLCPPGDVDVSQTSSL